jgi:hypothetical protein
MGFESFNIVPEEPVLPDESERVEDIEKARAMAKASDEAHTQAAKVRERIQGNPEDLGYTRDGISVDISSERGQRLNDKKSEVFWEEEARRDEVKAADKYDAKKEKGGLWKWFKK